MIQEKSSSFNSVQTKKQSIQQSTNQSSNHSRFMSTSQFGQHQIIQQYYKYISLLKRSDNLYQDISRYKEIPESMFSNLTIIGSINQLQTIKDEDNNDCMSISMITTIKYPSYFLNNVTTDQIKITKRDGKQVINKENIKRNLILLKEDYIKLYLKVFNKIVKDCKSNVNVFQKIYFITGLQMQLLNGNVYFAITDNSYIGSLQNQLYNRIFNPLQKSLGFFYSYVHTNFPINKDEEGYSLSAFQSQFIQMEKVSFTGVVQNYYIYNENRNQNQIITTYTQNPQQNYNSMNEKASKCQTQKLDQYNTKQKDKQIVIEVLQQNYRGKIEMIGIAKIIGKFHPKDQEEVMSYIQAGKIYLFSNLSLIISDNLAVNFKFNGKISNFITPIHKQANPSILPILDKVNVFQLRSLNTPILYRNIIKIEVSYVNCQFLFGKVECKKCKRIMHTKGICSNCGQNKGKLQLWAIVIVADETSYAQISLQSQTVFDYFNFTEEEIEEIYDMVFRQETHNKKMKKLFCYQTKFQPNNLCKFQKKLLFNFSCKTLVGVPKYNSNDTFKQLSSDQKQQFLISLFSPKEFMKKNNKVQFNGFSIKIDKQRKIVPFLKIKQVL